MLHDAGIDRPETERCVLHLHLLLQHLLLLLLLLHHHHLLLLMRLTLHLLLLLSVLLSLLLSLLLRLMLLLCLLLHETRSLLLLLHRHASRRSVNRTRLSEHLPALMRLQRSCGSSYRTVRITRNHHLALLLHLPTQMRRRRCHPLHLLLMLDVLTGSARIKLPVRLLSFRNGDRKRSLPCWYTLWHPSWPLLHRR